MFNNSYCNKWIDYITKQNYYLNVIYLCTQCMVLRITTI